MADETRYARADEMAEMDITMIGDTNYAFFTKFIPPEILPEIERGGGFALGAIVEDTACGAICLAFEGNAARLLSIIVAPDYRRQYVGTTLFCEVTELLEGSGEVEVGGIVARFSESKEGVAPFLKSLGFTISPLETKTLRVSLGALRECAFVKRPAGERENFVLAQLSSLSAYHFRKLNAVLDASGANSSGASISVETTVAQCSLACFQKDEAVGCVCFAPLAEKELVMSVFFVGNRSPHLAALLLQQAASLLFRHYRDDVTINLPLVEESSIRLAQSILEGAGEDVGQLCEAVLEFGRPVEDPQNATEQPAKRT